MFDKVFSKLHLASNENDDFAIEMFREVTSDLERIGLGWLELGRLLSSVHSNDIGSSSKDSSDERVVAQASFGEIIRDYDSLQLESKQLRFMEGVENFWIRNKYITDKQVVAACEILGHEEYSEAVAQYAGYAKPEWVADFKLKKKKKSEELRQVYRERIKREEKLIEEVKSILAPLKVSKNCTNLVYFERWKVVVSQLPYDRKPPSVSLQNYKAALNGSGSRSGRVAVALMVAKKPSELFIGSQLFNRTQDRSEEDLIWLEYLSLSESGTK